MAAAEHWDDFERKASLREQRKASRLEGKFVGMYDQLQEYKRALQADAHKRHLLMGYSAEEAQAAAQKAAALAEGQLRVSSNAALEIQKYSTEVEYHVDHVRPRQ